MSAQVLKRRGRKLGRRSLLCIWILAGVLFFQIAEAASPDDVQQANQQAEQLQRQEQLRLKQQYERDLERARPPSKIEVPVPAPKVSGEKAVCRNIQEIQVTGVTLIKAADLREVVERYQGKCLGVSDIEKLLSDITNLYVSRGFVAARAYLPQQDLSKGKLEVRVIEGKVEKILIRDGGKHSISLGNVAPGLIGKPLNLRDFEQALDQINRLASNNATFDMEPGSAPGDSVVVINNAPGSVARASLTYNNHGSESTGKNQVGVNLSFDNPLRMDDFVSLTHQRALPYDSTRRASYSNNLTYVVPHGYTTYSLNLSNSSYASMLQPASGIPLYTRGDSTNRSFMVDHLAYRDQTSRLNFSGTLVNKTSHNYLNDILLSVSSRTLSSIDLGSSYTIYMAGGALTTTLDYCRGLPIMGALVDGPNLPATAPRAQYTLLKYGATFNRAFKAGGRTWQFSSALTGQQSHDVLYGTEQISVGGIYTVRGFVNNVLAGDNGFYVRNELGTNFASSQGSLRVFAALDYGHTRSLAPGVPEGGMTGGAVGASFHVGRASMDLFYARPISQPSFMTAESGRVYFQLAVSM